MYSFRGPWCGLVVVTDCGQLVSGAVGVGERRILYTLTLTAPLLPPRYCLFHYEILEHNFPCLMQLGNTIPLVHAFNVMQQRYGTPYD